MSEQLVIQKEQDKDWRLLEFFTPIKEKALVGNDFIIRGVAINETTTLNNVKYVAEELEKAAPTFRDVPILLDHKNEVKNIVGRTTQNVFFEKNSLGVGSIPFEAKIDDVTIKEMINDGRIKNVSIGATVKDLVEEEDGSVKAIGIRGLELSFVAVPGDCNASLAHALDNSFMLKEKYESNKKVNHTDIVKKEDIKMAEEEQKVVPEAEPVVEPIVEPVAEEEKEEEKKEEAPVEEKAPAQNINIKVDNSAVDKLREELNELKALLLEKKKVKEELEVVEKKVDETKGEIGNVAEVQENSTEEGFVLENAGANKFALYRDYAKDKSGKLKRLIR